MSFNINDFALKALKTNLNNKYAEFVDLNIISFKETQYFMQDIIQNIVILKLNFFDMSVYFEYDLEENKDILEQCLKFTHEAITGKFFFNPKNKPEFKRVQEQIINSLIFNSSKSIKDIDYDIFKVLSYEVIYNTDTIREAQNYINEKFTENGDWNPLIKGNNNLKIRSKFLDLL